jgi:hypothetical protein
MGIVLRRKAFILVLIILTAVTFFTLKAEVQAAFGFYYCSVSVAGAGTGANVICLTAVNGSFTNTWMTTTSNPILATALSAISLGKYVWVACDPTQGVPTIAAMYMVN